MDDRPNLYGAGREELARQVAPLDPRPFRARQVFRWLYQRDELAPAAWTDLPLALREQLATRFRFERPAWSGGAQARDGTIKAEVALPGADRVEAVAIPADDRQTFCISSQVGCAFGCRFCMTARLGFRRNLEIGEIVGQVALLRAVTGSPVGEYNIVFMGMGEPLHNFERVRAALALLTDEEGFALPPRRITVSTVGLPGGILGLADLPRPPRLAVSLVTADQALRDELMPVSRRYRLDELGDAIRRFGAGRRERPTLEVVMLAGVNDHPRLAPPLARYARRVGAKVNLIEFNPTPELPYAPAPEERIEHFLRVLANGGVVGTVRRSRGQDAYAACGQLAFLAADAKG
jgi:23S rRNA (adenine2503-C2)-methyltransferase